MNPHNEPSTMNFFLGCAVWAYKGWVGEFYPPNSRSSDFLQLYSRRLTCVEGNTTFYAIPNVETVRKWAQQTPPGFKFCLKLPKEFTHNGLLVPSIPGAIEFIKNMQQMGDRTGPFFAQLPPSYSPKSLDDLVTFLSALSQTQAQLALEVRHADWFQPSHATALNNCLTELGIGRVLLDTRPIYNCPDDPQIASERRKPQLPLQPTVTASFSLIRFISHPERSPSGRRGAPSRNQLFLQEWVSLVENWLKAGTQIYFFVHCPVEEHSPGTARYFQQLLEQKGVPVPPLPWNELEPSFHQLSLF